MLGFKLIPENKTKFHFGTSDSNLKEYFSSDQLFSAIINNLALMYSKEKVAEIITHFNTNCSISSVFYGLDFLAKDTSQANNTLYFLPRPLGSIEISDKEEKERDLLSFKKIKKISFLSTGLFNEFVKTWNEETESFNYDLSQSIFLGKKFACTSEEIGSLNISSDELSELSFLKYHTVPKVTVQRFLNQSEEQNFYFQDELEIAYGETEKYIIRPFMYFIFRGELPTELKAAINLLADEGIGGRRSKGLGWFKSIEEINISGLPLPETNAPCISLACVYPSQDEAEKLIAYDLEDRSGYIYSYSGRPFRKKRVRVLKEGSIFSEVVNGEIVDVTPEVFDGHSVLLNGKSFLVPIGRG